MSRRPWPASCKTRAATSASTARSSGCKRRETTSRCRSRRTEGSLRYLRLPSVRRDRHRDVVSLLLHPDDLAVDADVAALVLQEAGHGLRDIPGFARDELRGALDHPDFAAERAVM